MHVFLNMSGSDLIIDRTLKLSVPIVKYPSIFTFFFYFYSLIFGNPSPMYPQRAAIPTLSTPQWKGKVEVRITNKFVENN